jgi:hypothetical protein
VLVEDKEEQRRNASQLEAEREVVGAVGLQSVSEIMAIPLKTASIPEIIGFRQITHR